MSEKLDTNDYQATSLPRSDEVEFSMNPLAPTKARFILLIIGLLLAFDRRSIIPILPFQLGLIGGAMPPECLMWTLVIVDMAKRDLVQMCSNIIVPPDSQGQETAAEAN